MSGAAALDFPDWPAVCGPPRSDSLSLFNDAGDSAHTGIPHSQLLEIDAPDAIYIIRRTSFDGGLQFRPGAVAQFAVDGKHLIIKFDSRNLEPARRFEGTARTGSHGHPANPQAVGTELQMRNGACGPHDPNMIR